MTHKDAMGQDINPDDIVAYSRASQSAGHLFGRVRGESPKMVQIKEYYSFQDAVADANKSPYRTSVRPENLIVITKLVP